MQEKIFTIFFVKSYYTKLRSIGNLYLSNKGSKSLVNATYYYQVKKFLEIDYPRSKLRGITPISWKSVPPEFLIVKKHGNPGAELRGILSIKKTETLLFGCNLVLGIKERIYTTVFFTDVHWTVSFVENGPCSTYNP